jgi:hypothetical protein
MVILFTKQARYNFAAPSNAAVASKPVGQWNTIEIETTGQLYSVMLNSNKVIPGFTGNRNTEDILESKIMIQIPMFRLRISE